jgi:hypothetical protein
MITLIAIYGALLSTLIALLQMRQYYSSQKFVHVQVRRTRDLSQEYVEFVISNRSGLSTEIREIMIGAYGRGGEVGFHVLWGSGATPYKTTKPGRDGNKVDLPASLSPGETLVVRYSSSDALKDIQFFSREDALPWQKDDKLSNLFYFEVEHSRANKPKEVLFEMDRNYLKDAVYSWREITSAKERLRLWPINRSYR